MHFKTWPHSCSTYTTIQLLSLTQNYTPCARQINLICHQRPYVHYGFWEDALTPSHTGVDPQWNVAVLEAYGILIELSEPTACRGNTAMQAASHIWCLNYSQAFYSLLYSQSCKKIYFLLFFNGRKNSIFGTTSQIEQQVHKQIEHYQWQSKIHLHDCRSSSRAEVVFWRISVKNGTK